MHLLGEFDRLLIANYFFGGAGMNYMGIDHHRQYSHVTLLDERGEVVKSGKVANLRRELENFLRGVNEVKTIAKAKVKTDKRDSYKLAHLLRTGYIPKIFKRSRENRSSQRVLRQRAFYVAKQTAVKNRLGVFLAQQGEEIRQEASRVENLFTAKGIRVVEKLALPEREAKMVGALLKTYHHLQERIDETNALVHELYETTPAAHLIQTVPVLKLLKVKVMNNIHIDYFI
jgi:transposase